MYRWLAWTSDVDHTGFIVIVNLLCSGVMIMCHHTCLKQRFNLCAFFLLFSFTVLGIEPRASGMLARCSHHWARPPPPPRSITYGRTGFST